MIEIFLAIRDGVGLNSRVLLDGSPTLIKELPPRAYDLYHQTSRIAQNLGPNQVPSFLLYYCADLEKKGFEFSGNPIYEKVSNLKIRVQESPTPSN